MAEKISPVLAEAHRLLRHLSALGERIDQLPTALKARRARLDKQAQAFLDAREALQRLRLRAREDEVSLKAAQDQVAKWEAQARGVIDAKQYTALQAEITAGRARCAELGESIFAAMAGIEERAEVLPERELELEAAREEFAAFERESNELHARLVREVSEAEAELRAVEGKLPRDVKAQYDRLVNAYGPEALAAVSGRACGHCHAGLTVEQLTRLQGGAWVLCPGCGRGAYLDS